MNVFDHLYFHPATGFEHTGFAGVALCPWRDNGAEADRHVFSGPVVPMVGCSSWYLSPALLLLVVRYEFEVLLFKFDPEEAVYNAQCIGPFRPAKYDHYHAWNEFQTVALGQVQIAQPGDLTVKIRAADANTWKAINVRSLALTPR